MLKCVSPGRVGAGVMVDIAVQIRQYMTCRAGWYEICNTSIYDVFGVRHILTC